MDRERFDFIAVGVSAGGVSALQNFFVNLKGRLSVPMAVVIHLPPDSTVKPSLVFQRCTSLPIVEVCDKMPVESGTIYFAPAGYHLMLENRQFFSLNVDEPINFSRPSIDVFFESVARSFKNRGCGVLLTGASADGALGLLSIHKNNGITVVQDPQEAECSTMPESALRLFKPDLVGRISDISSFLEHHVKGDHFERK